MFFFFFRSIFFILTISQEVDGVSLYTVYVKQTGDDNKNGTLIGYEKKSLKSAYETFNRHVTCQIIVVKDTTALTAEALTFNKSQIITIEGFDSKGEANEIVSINCDVHPGKHLFSCYGKVSFKYLAFNFPITLKEVDDSSNSGFSLIDGHNVELEIRNCQFIRPLTSGKVVHIGFVHIWDGSLVMDSVECTNDDYSVTFEDNLFYVRAIGAVSLTNVSLKKVTCERSAIFYIYSSENQIINFKLNGSSFTECMSHFYGVFYVFSSSNESTFSVGNEGVTSFDSCSCSGSDFQFAAGGICLSVANVTSASLIKWPENGQNLIFKNCSVGFNNLKRNTALVLRMDNHSLFEDIANAMRESFAANYTRMDNRRHVIGYDSENHREFDFTVLYFDPHPPKPENMKRAFVKNRGNGDGITVEKAIDSISDAYDYLDKSGKCFIDIIKTDDLLKADPVLFKVSNGITIEGVNGNGEGNTEVVVDCDVSESSVLFFCLRMVEFKYLAFQFSATKKSWDFFIRADPGLERLVLSHCQFVRVGSQSQRGMNSNDDGDNSIGYNLITVCDGTVEMNTVKCTDETSFVTFSSSPFSFSGASEVLLNGVEISNLKFSYGPAIFISDSEETAAKIFIEGLNIKNSHSELGYTAGLWISLVSEESTVAIGRNDKCSFKSCSAPEGKSGAIFIDMPKATSNLQLPSANNLEIDSSNTAGSESTSLFIIAPDFDEFCKQEDAFEFANDYDESTSGWIKGAKDEESEPEDVYEKYVKVRQEQLKKKKVGTIVAIVVPVVVVVVAAVVAVVIVVVVRKRRKRNEENENKEQEMNSL